MTEPASEPRPLVVPAEEVARRIGVPTDPLADADLTAITDALYDAQDDIEGYLGRPITPVTVTESGLYPHPDGWVLREAPVVAVVAATPDTDSLGGLTGTYTVTYTAGLNAAADEKYRTIRREVLATVLEHPAVIRLWRAALPTTDTRRIRSAAVEGQSVTYDFLTPTGAEGKPEDQAARRKRLDRWRLAGRRVFERTGTPQRQRPAWEWFG